MPYIKPEERPQYDALIAQLCETLQKHQFDPGHLNYVFSCILTRGFHSNPRYAEANKLMGVLACVSEEFYRKSAAPYEDLKIAENGDIPRTAA